MKYLAAAIFLFISTVAGAATLDSKEAAVELADNIMKKVVAGDVDGGFLLMKPYLIIPESEFTVMTEQTKLQLPMIQGRFGKTLGYEFVSEQMVGKSLLKVVHIQKYEKHIMRWNFIFYRPNGKWVLNTFTFDDNIRSMFCD
jgi:hypothetical protein